MINYSPVTIFKLLSVAGFSLTFVIWLQHTDTEGFLLLLFLVVMYLTRWRLRWPHVKYTIVIDLLAALIFFIFFNGSIGEATLDLAMFQALFWGIYPAGLFILYLAFVLEPISLVLTICMTLCGMLLNFWKKEWISKLELRDQSNKRYYELESLQNDLTATLAQVEQMTIIAERSRISRDIHDNAGHEIIAAFISLQTARSLMENADPEVLELYDMALERLNLGVEKMRNAVHNMSAVTFMGVDSMREICGRFPICPVDFQAVGDTSVVTTNIWNVMEACLSESLTNITRHSQATYVTVELDATPHLVRLMIENDGVTGTIKPLGSGLRNLRHRATIIGGNLSVDASDKFRLICVIPIK